MTLTNEPWLRIWYITWNTRLCRTHRTVQYAMSTCDPLHLHSTVYDVTYRFIKPYPSPDYVHRPRTVSRMVKYSKVKLKMVEIN